MVPTLVRTLGVKGHRPVVGTRDNKDVVFAFASMNVVTGRLTSRLLTSEARIRCRHGAHKTRRLQHGFARHLDEVARAYPATQHRRVVLTIDNAPWHRGKPITDALARNPHLELYRLPSYSPNLNDIERFWKILRRRATHNRLFDHVTEMCGALRASIRYFQTTPRRILSLVLSDRKRAKLPAA